MNQNQNENRGTRPTSADEAGPSLCDRCEQRASCGWATASRLTRQFCEEMPPEPTVAFLGRTAPAPVAGRSSAPAADLLGLCSDCGEAATCTFHKPVGGVWHCEEYR